MANPNCNRKQGSSQSCLRRAYVGLVSKYLAYLDIPTVARQGSHQTWMDVTSILLDAKMSTQTSCITVFSVRRQLRHFIGNLGEGFSFRLFLPSYQSCVGVSQRRAIVPSNWIFKTLISSNQISSFLKNVLMFSNQIASFFKNTSWLTQCLKWGGGYTTLRPPNCSSGYQLG
jgi:hypothetical protein